MHKVLVNCLFKLAKEKNVVRLTDRPAMTIAVDLGHKATKQTNKQNVLKKIRMSYQLLSYVAIFSGPLHKSWVQIGHCLKVIYTLIIKNIYKILWNQ